MHTAARICSAGHGGHILMSAATRDSLEEVSGDITFRSRGRHALAGLPEPQALFLVRAADLQRAFPGARATAAR